MRKIWLAAMALAIAVPALAQEKSGLSYTPDGKMIFPAGYRDWVFLTSGMDMSYVEGSPPAKHEFDNVFVDPASYASFLKTGVWPDKTVMIKEDRAAGADPFNKQGQFQSGAPIAVETHVKDAAKGGWAFYTFGPAQAPGAPFPKTAGCFSCHEQHGQTDTTFTQFYPTLAGRTPAK